MSEMRWQIIVFAILYILVLVKASAGDRNQFNRNCLHNCKLYNCSEDGLEILEHAEEYLQQGYFDKVLRWSCEEECRYRCMWRTVNAFIDRSWPIPQFNGKWPFVRFLGLQEPASVIFSVINLSIHVHLLHKFRVQVHSDSPGYKLWHFFGIICINGWIWSSVFHARDTLLTEFLDYTSAYSIVLVSFYTMVMRIIYQHSKLWRISFSVLCLSFYLNYIIYIIDGSFDYSFNMKTNVFTGIFSGIGWIFWFLNQRKRLSYAWKILLFQILLAISILFELRDFPPIFWVFDAHSLWHLSSIPITFIFYSFITDDCQQLRKEKIKENIKKE